jgi:histidinol-phosphate phosphatase family protein
LTGGTFSVVVPTIGRPSLGTLLRSLENSTGPEPVETIVVDDRPDRTQPLLDGNVPAWVKVASTDGGCGPAAARNAGWRLASAPWVSFLDDDVVVPTSWKQGLSDDLSEAERSGVSVAGSQGRIRVSLPAGRKPTDWERNVAGLETACWATADMAYRRDVLEEVEGFDEHFPRAYREDSDIALRVTAAGYLIVRGERMVDHPVAPASRWISVRLQRGNADDARMRRRFGPDWRDLCHAGRGRNGGHAVAVGSLMAAVAASVAGRRRAAALATSAWAVSTGRFAWQRISPGPRTFDEILTMMVTSAVIPPVAIWHRARSEARLRIGDRDLSGLAMPFPTLRARVLYGPVPRPLPVDPGWKPKAVLFDRDGTLIVDKVYLSDPAGVTMMPGARVAVGRLRRAGLAVGVVSNQSGVARGLMTRAQLDSVNRRVDEFLGGLDTWAVCPHGSEEGCGCRKPAPGLVLAASEALGARPEDCVVIGDIASDVGAAEAAGARAVLVPSARTRRSEIRAARQVAPDLLAAVDLVLGGRL